MPSDHSDPRVRRALNLIEMLRNDMRSTVELKCHLHGTATGTTANMTVALLPMIGLEMAAQFTRTSADTGKNAAVRRIFRELAAHSARPSYATLGFSLWALYRNGLAHGFYPTQDLTVPGVGTFRISTTPTMWILSGPSMRTECIDVLTPASFSSHLTLDVQGAGRTLHVDAQALFLDVDGFLATFAARCVSDTALASVVGGNQARLEKEGAEALGQKSLKSADLMALQIP